MKLVLLIIFAGLSFTVRAQKGYSVNDVTGDFPISKILNHTVSNSYFRQFKDRLLIVDFFGTWCVPCIKALPKLSALQNKYKYEIRVLLVSEEPQIKLENFIKKQTGFGFPVVVDEEKNFITLFQPPTYPYTAIIGKNGKVLALPAQEEITEGNIDRWLQQQDAGSTIASKSDNSSETQLSSGNNRKTEVEPSKNKLVQLSQEFMYAAKTGDETSDFIAQLRSISMDELTADIKTDDDKKAFWINLYNAYTQVALKKDAGQYKKRGKFFGNKQIVIAAHRFSLDDIEHGILRRSKIKWSLGHFNKLFPGKTEKELRVEKLDYRLHFALNCGAKSCPPIAFYKPENINQQLELATNAYLKSEAEYDEAGNIVKLPALMSWFRRDFGGKKKMLSLLRQLSVIPSGKQPKIKFKKYDWTLYLENYKS